MKQRNSQSSQGLRISSCVVDNWFEPEEMEQVQVTTTRFSFQLKLLLLRRAIDKWQYVRLACGLLNRNRNRNRNEKTLAVFSNLRFSSPLSNTTPFVCWFYIKLNELFSTTVEEYFCFCILQLVVLIRALSTIVGQIPCTQGRSCWLVNTVTPLTFFFIFLNYSSCFYFIHSFILGNFV